MPSVIVHMGLAALVGTALLGNYFDAKTINIVILSVLIPELDSLTAVIIPGTHRALLHNIFLPTILTIILLYDIKYREKSLIKTRYGERGIRTAITAITVILFVGIGLDMFTSGVNLFYPIHNQFYNPEGKIVLSTKRGLVQTLIDTKTQLGTTKTMNYGSGIDPSPPSEPKKTVERILPIAKTGINFYLMMTGFLITGIRIWEDRILKKDTN